MNVLVDTSVWSLALRRRPGRLNALQLQVRTELAELVREGRVEMPGLVRQELLSGLREERRFERLRRELRAYDDVPVEVEDHEEAARICNHCRQRGLAGSTVDFLLCAIALRRGWALFTTDKDFVRYARHTALRLHEPRPAR